MTLGSQFSRAADKEGINLFKKSSNKMNEKEKLNVGATEKQTRMGKNKIGIKSKMARKIGGYTDDKGIRHLSEKEQRAKIASWPKEKKGGSEAWPETDAQKRTYQNKFGRAWND